MSWSSPVLILRRELGQGLRKAKGVHFEHGCRGSVDRDNWLVYLEEGGKGSDLPVGVDIRPFVEQRFNRLSGVQYDDRHIQNVEIDNIRSYG